MFIIHCFRLICPRVYNIFFQIEFTQCLGYIVSDLSSARVSCLGYVVEDGQVDLELPRDLIDRVLVRVVINGLVVQQKLHAFKLKISSNEKKKNITYVLFIYHLFHFTQ